MATWTKEEDVPSEFPPARLFLDDIEEIVRIFRELVESRNVGSRSTVEDLKTKVWFSTAGEECDEIQDLPKIAKSYRQLNINVSRGSWPQTTLRLSPTYTMWVPTGFSKEETWAAFRKLQPIFKKRKRLWSTFLHSFPWWLSTPVVCAFLLLFPQTPLEKLMPRNVAGAIMLLLYVLIFIAIALGARSTYLTPRYSWDPSPFRHYLKDKLIPVVTGALLGIGGTILTLFLRHKYWP
jgi:hypothetical protein